MLILKNCRLIPELTEGYGLKQADILIHDNIIEKIAPVGAISAENCSYIDLHNQTLLPGMIDLHCHLMWTKQNRDYCKTRTQNEYLLDCIEFDKHYLKTGFTTVRDCGSDYYANVAVREASNRNIFNGTRVISSGKCLSPTVATNYYWGGLYKSVDGAENMLSACREEMAHGCDFIKYMSTGTVLGVGGSPGQMITTDEETAAVSNAAEKLGTYVASHCHGLDGIKSAICNGIKTIEHATYMDEECISMILAKGNDISIVPTVSIFYAIANGFHSQDNADVVRKGADGFLHATTSMQMANDAGILIGFGTDYDLEFAKAHPGNEFIARKAMGMSNIDILKQATINGARVLGIENKLGSIKEGKIADLVVFNGNPDHDITAMKEYPTLIIKDGKIID